MINAIFAVDRGGGLGLNGTLPWHVAQDLAHFKQVTSGHIVIMGRRTWDDPKMPKPLPDRETIVVTNRAIPDPKPGVRIKTMRGDIKSKILELEQQRPDKKIFIIGGKELLLETRDILDGIYLTYINSLHRIDTRLNMAEFLSGFRALSADYQGPCTFMTFKSLIKDEAVSRTT